MNYQQLTDINNLRDEDEAVLVLNIANSGLQNDFNFEMAMRLLPLKDQASVLRKKFKSDQIKALCNRLLQLFGCLIMLKDLLDEKPELVFTRGPFGKPLLDTDAMGINHKLAFSMTNGEEHICMYLKRYMESNNEVGIDIASNEDLHEPEELPLYKDVLTSTEYLTLNNSSQTDMKKLFAHYWSLKESFTKYLGTGLNIDLKKYDFGTIEMDQPSTVTEFDGQVLLFRSFWVQEDKREVITICERHHPDGSNNIEVPKVLIVSFKQLLTYLM